jgi:hypothetical protein
VLTDVITKNCGVMFSKPNIGTLDSSRSFTIVPSSTPREEAPQGHAGGQVVTEMWIERCIAANTAFNAEQLVMCTPMPGPFPRPCTFPFVQ